MTQHDVPRPVPAPSERREAELKEIMSDLRNHSERLMQQELQLALIELDVRTEKTKVAARRGVISGALLYASYLSALTAVVLLLSEVVLPWLAALLVAILAGGGALFFTRLSKHAIEEVKRPAEAGEPFRSRSTAHR